MTLQIKRFAPLVSRFGSTETRILIALILCAGSVWALVKLVSEVIYEREDAVDRSILIALRLPNDPSVPIGPLWLSECARDVTSLGSTSVLMLVVVEAIAFLLLNRRLRPALHVAAAALGGSLLVAQLKQVLGRQRPNFVPAAADLHTLSFPSGHATMSAIIYLTLAAQLSRIVPSHTAKSFVVASALFVTMLVGASRVYLGVHWPTDVLAGWILGAAWALFCWAVVERLEKRHSQPNARSNPSH